MRALLTPAHYSGTFAAMDTDHDGHIDRDEFRAFVVGVTEQDAHRRILKQGACSVCERQRSRETEKRSREVEMRGRDAER